ncbi:MAG: TIGR04283 family arsenosugar biosynthesis glycosyltransferase [Xanthomonadales bacterium]|nr:TIGR04283 family arsenosugar biosynthesis glycosyltransferase [Xanthomonadales bacterium]
MKVSVVIPTLNEASQIEACLASLQKRRDQLELIVVDGGSTDGTPDLAEPLVDRVVSAPRGRAVQLNAGWRAARGAIVLFLHADTRVDRRHFDALQAADVQVWGRFDVRIDGRNPLFRLIERMMNLRSRLTGIATGDQAIFVRRALLEDIGGFPELPLMEDVAVSKLLRRRARPLCLRPPVQTSARRWESQGILRTMVRMWCLRLAYALGVSAERLATHYRDARD